uniref:Uncharacterized protein n=2 Tax=Chlamydomonas euryale TaxID=1486919 RepID=A0A7R9V7Y4_9CHLO|mmetsp:Transcript_23879/g.70876  ORF Transcript_23879/g.70876 Transcript_23879/m.70876 type:complete len:118 (+) Transcript_23879:439-792(+)|eukprot:363309-Chlamydomonas_euryale.AAC.39
MGQAVSSGVAGAVGQCALAAATAYCGAAPQPIAMVLRKEVGDAAEGRFEAQALSGPSSRATVLVAPSPSPAPSNAETAVGAVAAAAASRDDGLEHPKYYPCTSMPVQGWMQPCRQVR